MNRYFSAREALPLLFLLSAGTAYSFTPKLTGAEAGLAFYPEYNAGSHYAWDIAALGLLELNELLVLRGGLTVGRIWDTTAINAHVSAEYRFLFFKPFFPLNLKSAYIYNGLPAWETHVHTFLPLLGLSWRYFGGSVGAILRHTFFAGDSAFFEPILAYSLYVNFYHTEEARVGMGFSNFDDFSADNLASYSFTLNNWFRLARCFSVSGEFKITVSGNVGRLISVYGISYAQGVVFTW